MKDTFIVLSLGFIVATLALRLDIPTVVPAAPVPAAPVEVSHFELTPDMAEVMPAIAPARESAGYEWYEVLEAIRLVETGGEPNEGLGAVGDGGKAIGPFQIWLPYFVDATERTYENIPTANIAYEDCATSRWAAETIVLAYMYRYARPEFQRLEAGTATLADVEKIARIHNGGPKGHTKAATLAYWTKVQEML